MLLSDAIGAPERRPVALRTLVLPRIASRPFPNGPDKLDPAAMARAPSTLHQRTIGNFGMNDAAKISKKQHHSRMRVADSEIITLTALRGACSPD